MIFPPPPSWPVVADGRPCGARNVRARLCVRVCARALAFSNPPRRTGGARSTVSSRSYAMAENRFTRRAYRAAGRRTHWDDIIIRSSIGVHAALRTRQPFPFSPFSRLFFFFYYFFHSFFSHIIILYHYYYYYFHRRSSSNIILILYYYYYCYPVRRLVYSLLRFVRVLFFSYILFNLVSVAAVHPTFYYNILYPYAPRRPDVSRCYCINIIIF